jgi:predicted HTH domain antitoxin
MIDRKIAIAIRQLKSSIQLYKKNDFVSSITLAGAAEEILGKIAVKLAQQNALLNEKVFLDQVAELLEKPKADFKKIIKQRNKVKNFLKHYDDNLESSIEKIDYKTSAEDLIIAAINNYFIIFEDVPDDIEIKEFWDNISL